MMVGTRYYSEADMLRMQRDAEDRVREMRNRSRQTAPRNGGSSFMPAFVNPNRNWNANPNAQRMRGNDNSSWQSGNRNNINGPRKETPPFTAPDPVEQTPYSDEPAQGHEAYEASSSPSPAPEQEKTGTTIIDDIIGSIGIDSDTLLIIGLILILVNQKADTTLILALAYLLI